MNIRRAGSSSSVKRPGSLLFIAQFFFLSVGLVAVGYCAYVLAEAHLYQAYESWRLDEMRQNRPASATDFVKSELASLWTRVTGRPAPWAPAKGAARPLRAAPSEGSLLGRIAVPRIGLSSIVLEGDDTNVLQLAVGHIPGTALPGEAGNAAIAGHRDTFFRRLRNVRKNDEVTLTTPQATYRYRVESTQVVGPDETAVLKPAGEPSLTLVTCYPFDYVGSAPERFIVHARQVGPVERSAGRGSGGAVSVALAASRLPSTLPGESPATPPHRAQLHRRHRTRPDKSVAPQAPSDTEDELAAVDSQSSSRQQRVHALASRLRKDWSRLFAHLKGNEE